MKTLSEIKLSKSGGISKDEFINVWQNLQPIKQIKPQFVEYKHSGSTIDEDGIRITGNLEFIESVVSRLQDLLKFENNEATRLQISCSELTDKETGERMTGKYRCSIQVHERGTGGLGILERMKKQKLKELYAA